MHTCITAQALGTNHDVVKVKTSFLSVGNYNMTWGMKRFEVVGKRVIHIRSERVSAR